MNESDRNGAIFIVFFFFLRHCFQMEWLKEQGFGGIMVWSIDMDDFSGRCGGGKYPLLRSLNQELEGYKVNLEYDGPYETHGPRGAYTTKDRK